MDELIDGWIKEMWESTWETKIMVTHGDTKAVTNMLLPHSSFIPPT